MPTSILEVDIKSVSATTDGADHGKQIVTLVFQCDDSVNIIDQLKADERTGIEVPSHAPHG